MSALDRAAVDTAVGRVLFNNSNYPKADQIRMIGQDTSMLRGLIVNAIMNLEDQDKARTPSPDQRELPASTSTPRSQAGGLPSAAIVSPREALVSVLEEFDPGDWHQDPRIDQWLDRIATAIDDQDAADHEECDSEIWSWSRFSPNAVDPYWIRCGLLGPHEKHEDSNTGATWTDEDAA